MNGFDKFSNINKYRPNRNFNNMIEIKKEVSHFMNSYDFMNITE